MATRIYNYSENEIKPSVEFEISRSKEGLWTCSQVFTCRYTDYGNQAVSDRLKKGTPVTDLNPNIPTRFSFITLESQRFQHTPGGITEIYCDFSGAQEDDGWQSPENDKSTSTSYRGVLAQTPIIEHPKFLKDTEDNLENRRALVGVYDGKRFVDETQSDKNADGSYISPFIVETATLSGGGLFTSFTPAHLAWFDLIHTRGIRYYDKPLLEYTITQANKGGITREEIDKFGRYVETPPGDPVTPTWFDDATAENPKKAWWQMTGITEDKDENSSVFSRTYTMQDSELIDLIHNYTIYEPTT